MRRAGYLKEKSSSSVTGVEFQAGQSVSQSS